MDRFPLCGSLHLVYKGNKIVAAEAEFDLEENHIVSHEVNMDSV